MTINLHLPFKNELLRPTITVIGVGGAGGNAVNNMIASNLEGVNFVVANTDAQALDNALTERSIQLGASITRGLGAGANPEVGRAAAEEAGEEIASHLQGSNMVFITAGMGGGTGTGAAPVVARLAKEQGILTVAVVTKPFQFEGSHRMRMAENGLKDLQEYVDTLIIIPNQNLFRIANERTTFADAFKMADEVLHSGVRGVTDLMVKPGMINLDFADIRTVMREMGKAMMGTGEGEGDRRAVEAAEAAISNPLLDDVSLKGARAVLINITGGTDMTLFEVDEAANRIREEVDADANIIFGSAFNEGMEGRMRVSVVATGIDAQADALASPRSGGSGDQKKTFAFASVRNETARTPAKASDAAARPPFTRAEESSAPRSAAEMPATVEAMAAPIVEPSPAVMQEQAAAAPPAPVMESPVKTDAAPEAASVASATFTQQAADMPAVSPRREPRDYFQRRDDGGGRSLFQRVAEVGRVLSARHESAAVRAEPAPRNLQVAERKPAPVPQEAPRQREEEQYLDIPAFLRRQAN